MPSRFARLYPFLWKHRASLAWGALALVAANYFDVKALVLLGDGLDLMRLRLETLGGLQRGLLLGTLVVTVLTILAGAVARFWMRWLIIGVSREVEFGVRNALFAHLERLSPSFYRRHPTGDLMARATNDLEAVRMVIGPAAMYLASVAVMMPLSLYQMLRISWTLTLATWLPLVFIAPLFYVFSRRIHARFTRVQETFSEISSRCQETLTGIRVVKAHGREAQVAEGFERLSQRYVGDNMRLALVQAFFIPLLGLIVGLSLLALVTVGSALILGGRSGRGPTAGSLVAFFGLTMANIWPLAAIGWVLSVMERGAASMRRLDALFEAEPEGVDPPAPADLPPLRGRLEARRLTFTYPGESRPALEDFTVTVPAGGTLGLTGPVGSGKSTLAALLMRRDNPPRGALFVDGRDILNWPLAAYRARVAIVDQEPFIFSDSLRANIAYGLPEGADGVVEMVAQIARLDDEVRDFPAGYETVLGERGITLSGGQRQRTALARALALDPAVLILDDALAAVDAHTEEAILQGLAGFMAGRTTLLISHRIRAVSLADHIVYLEDGRIVEEGTHEQLMALGGHYFDLARRQQLAEEIEATA